MDAAAVFDRTPEELLLPRIIFHADDLGFNSSIDRGIIDSFEHGILTSTSVLANGPTADVALHQVCQLSAGRLSRAFASRAKRQLLDDINEPFDIGIHLNLTQGRPLTTNYFPAELLDQQGRFLGPYSLFFKLLARPRRWLWAIQAELNEQISRILDQGIQPTHANGHQYIELYPGVREILPELLKRFSIRVTRVPLEYRLGAATLRKRHVGVWMLALMKRKLARQFASRIQIAGLGFPDAFIGSVHAGHMTIDVISQGLLPAKWRAAEIAIHPGGPSPSFESSLAADGWHDPLANLRDAERSLLCSQSLVDLLWRSGLRLGRLRHLSFDTTN